MKKRRTMPLKKYDTILTVVTFNILEEISVPFQKLNILYTYFPKMTRAFTKKSYFLRIFDLRNSRFRGCFFCGAAGWRNGTKFKLGYTSAEMGRYGKR